MPLLSPLTGWNFARRLVLPTPGEDLVVELSVPSESSDHRTYCARLKSVGFRRLLMDQVSSPGQALDDADYPRLRNKPAIASFARDSALYRFETTVETTFAPGTNEYLLSLSRPRRVDRLQRRNAYRVTVETRTTYRELGRTGGGSSQLLNAQIMNLSEGGVLIGSATPIADGQQVVIRIPSGRDGSPMDVMAACIECRAMPTTRGASYRSRLHFDDHDSMRLPEDQREAIVRYVFEQQRLMLQTRRLLGASGNKKAPAVD